MADWKSSMSRFAQNAMTKSKEMAEITRVNMEITTAEQKIKELQQNLGKYLLDNPQLIPQPDEAVAGLIDQAQHLQASLQELQQTLLDLRNVNICPKCGAEVSRTSQFCGKCGTPIERKVLASAGAAAAKVCPACGEPVEEGALFCGSCGEKLK